MSAHLPPCPPYRSLGQRLRAGRQAKPGLTVALLAVAVGVRPGTIYQYEAGHHRPRRATLRRLAAIVDIEYGELATLAGYSSPCESKPDRADDRGTGC